MRTTILASVILCSFAVAASAVSEPATRANNGERAPVPYALELGDIMTSTQLRHLKLGFAGKVENWDLASYEVDKLRKTFDAAAQSFSPYRGLPLADMIDRTSRPALADIEKAIDAKNLAAFSKSYERLTDECNSCHRVAKVGFIVIRVPTASPFSNQVFTPHDK